MRRIKQGLCVGGPDDGKRKAAMKDSYTCAKLDEALSIHVHEYHFVPLSETGHAGIWRHESLTRDQALVRLLAIYELCNDREGALAARASNLRSSVV